MQTVTYRFTEADLVDARGYAYFTLPVVRVIRLLPYGAALIGLAVGAWSASRGDWDIATPAFCWAVGGVTLIGWMVFGDRWLLPRSVRKSLARDKGFQDEMVLSWDAGQLTLEASHGQSRWPWGDFWQWRESAGGLLLYQSPRLYNYVPKRVLTDAQIAEMRGYLTSSLGKVGKKRK